MIIELKGQALKIEDSVIAEGALNFVTFRVKCDKAWKKRNITVRFYHSVTEESVDFADIKEAKSYYFPESLLKKGIVEIGAIGIDSKGEVVTTQKKEIEIKGSISNGATPKVTKDAYEQYVNDVLYHRKKCERAEKTALEALKKCEKAEKSMKKMYSACQKSEMMCREILENVSGALDAIGISMRDVRLAENKLLLAESDLRKGEENRECTERLRRIEEREREKNELLRRESEIERDISEKGRVTSEKARVIAEAERNKKLCDFNMRLTALEEENSSFPHYSEEISFDTTFIAESPQKLKKLRLFGISLIEGHVIKSVAQEGRIKIKFDGREYEIELKDSLRGIEEFFDELLIEKDEAFLIRRTVELTFNGDEDIVEEEAEEGKSSFILPLPYDVIINTEKSVGISTYFDFEKEVTVSGNHICLLLPKKEYPNKSKLSEKLRKLKEEGTPFSLILPMLKEKRESICLETLPDYFQKFEVQDSCLGAVYLEKNIFETVEKIKEKIEEIKKER